MAERGDTLVYGGGSYGLMGEVARATHAGGGRVIGIMPTFLKSQEFVFHDADEMIITTDMRERKAGMYQRADAFIALPGGIGTLEEVFEIMTLRSLNIAKHPLVLINTCGFYDPLQALLDKMNEERFLRRPVSEIFYLAADAFDALSYIDAHVELQSERASQSGA